MEVLSIAQEQKAAVTNIHEEVSMLREEAIERISHEDIAAVLIKDNLDLLKVLTEGEYPVIVPKQFDKQGNPLYKMQAWNDMLWTIAITTMCEHEYLSAFMLGHVIVNWGKNKDNYQGGELHVDTCVSNAALYVAELQMMGCLQPNAEPHMSVVDGQIKQEMVFKLTPEYITVVQDVRKQLSKTRCMRFQPLRFKPEPWTDNFTGIGNDAHARLIKGQHERKVSKHVLEAVNALQSVPYVVHPDMKQLAKVVLANENYYRVLWEHDVDEWQDIVKAWRSLATLEVGTTYYFSVTMDFRGRMYYRGGMVTPQGSDFAKAAFVYQRALPLGDWGFGGLCIAFANALDMKGTQVQKVYRVEGAAKSGALSTMLADFNAFCKQYPNVDHCQAYVLGKDIIAAVQHNMEHGTYSTYHSCIPCHQDGTCNGLQHQAAITKDIVTARATNMCSSGYDEVPQDVYGLVVNGLENEVLRALGRDIGKKPVMLSGYGAGNATLHRRMADTLKKYNVVCKQSMFDDMLASMQTQVPALSIFTDNMNSIAVSAIAQGSTEFTWEAYDGFVVKQQYVNNESNVIRGGSFTAHVDRHPVYVDGRKMGTALSPNFIHSIDSAHARQTVVACKWDVTTVHDSIASHACNFFGTNKVLRQQMYAVHAGYDHLQDLCNNLEVDKPVFIGEYDVEEVLTAKNIFG